MTLDADSLTAGYGALFPPLMRAAHRACLEHAQLVREDRWPSIPDCIAFARLYGVPAAELAAFFGYVAYCQGRTTIWADALSGGPGSHVARALATREQLCALGFQLACGDAFATERREAAH